MPLRWTPVTRALAGGLLAVAIALASGCASSLQSKRLVRAPGDLTQRLELKEVPFFPQEAYQCGPAALATVLNAAGASVAPEALVPQVYLPDRQGSLQLELLGATRQHGFVPYVLEPRFADLLKEVEAGNPVLVLQNLGVSWYPKWHYAVVVGFDLSQGEIILRSGREARYVIAMRRFEHTWKRSGYWAMVSVPPDRVPHTASEARYVRAIVDFERVKRWHDATRAYETALSRWPNNLVARLGLGNSRYALGDLPNAEVAYRQAIHDHPQAAPAFNNLAQVLAEQGRFPEAEVAARRAVQLGGP
ncbi:MAG: PA2778 family cysteine peptidase, partial [Acidiferrobacterales bacterium]|nr:PA2778 family cysteine peptidase [Acidiferrobacterales bacterium]